MGEDVVSEFTIRVRTRSSLQTAHKSFSFSFSLPSLLHLGNIANHTDGTLSIMPNFRQDPQDHGNGHFSSTGLLLPGLGILAPDHPLIPLTDCLQVTRTNPKTCATLFAKLPYSPKPCDLTSIDGACFLHSYFHHASRCGLRPKMCSAIIRYHWCSE